MPRLKKLAISVVTVGRGDDDDHPHERVLCKTLKVGIGHLRARWMRFPFGRDGIISLESLMGLVFPVTSEVDSWMPGVHELFGQAPRVETAMVSDWRVSHQNLDRKSRLFFIDSSDVSQDTTPIPDINNISSLVVFVPLAYTDRCEVHRALVLQNTKVNTADMTICALDWTRRMLDTSTRLKEVDLLCESELCGG